MSCVSESPAALAAAIAGTAVPAFAQSSGYTIAPAGPADPRNNYVPQAGAVFVVDDAKGGDQHVFPRQQGQQGRGGLHAGDQAAAIG
jgi:hypothetical protein